MPPKPRPALVKAAGSSQHPLEPSSPATLAVHSGSAFSQQLRPAPAAMSEPLVMLSARIPASLRKAIRRHLAEYDLTLQELLVKALERELSSTS